MKKIILTLFFVMVFFNFVNASGLYPISMADLITPTCNNNGRCDYFENAQTCPNECPGTNATNNTEENTMIISTTSTTLEITSIIPAPENITSGEENQQPVENVTNTENQQRSDMIIKQPSKTNWTLILSLIFAVGILLLVVVRYLWVKEKSPASGKEGKKLKVESKEDEFGLPSRPKRGFGV